MLILFAAVLIVCVRIDGIEIARDQPMLQEAANSKKPITLEIRLSGFPQNLEGKFEQRHWVRGKTTLVGGDVKLVLWNDGTADPAWVPGTHILATGVLHPQDSASTAAYSFNLTEHHEDEQESQGRVFSVYQSVVANLRHGLATASAQLPGADLVPGFAVGDTSLITSELDAAMKESSLTHLIAVSGSNCALITGAIMWAASWCGVGKRTRIVVAGLSLGGFVIIVGPDPSIQRAAIMAAVTLISGFGGKRSHGLPALGIAILLLLWADPWQSREAGFTLSVAATGGIMLMTPTLGEFSRTRLSIPRWLSLPLTVTISAQIACSPLLLFLQPGLPMGGVLANLLAAPAAPLGTGIGLGALLTLPISSIGGDALVFLASIPARWVEWVAYFTAALPLSRWHWPGGGTGALLLVVAQGSIIAAITLKKRLWNLGGNRRYVARLPWRGESTAPRIVKRTSWVLWATGIGTLVAVSLITPVMQRVVTPDDWIIVMCDVGQGDAIMIRDPDAPSNVLLTDTGEHEEELDECLKTFGVKHVSLLVLTHDHIDHTGALGAVVGMTDSALVSRRLTGETETRNIERVLAKHEVPFEIGEEGLLGTLGRDNEVHWQILAPTQTEPLFDENPASIVMLVSVGKVRILLLGDTGQDAHIMLLSRYPTLTADIVKVAHHGSGDQEPRLLSQVGAQYGLISSGAGNRYGHPNEKLLSDLHSEKIIPLRSDQRGSVAIVEKDGELHVWSEK